MLKMLTELSYKFTNMKLSEQRILCNQPFITPFNVFAYTHTIINAIYNHLIDFDDYFFDTLPSIYFRPHMLRNVNFGNLLTLEHYNVEYDLKHCVDINIITQFYGIPIVNNSIYITDSIDNRKPYITADIIQRFYESYLRFFNLADDNIINNFGKLNRYDVIIYNLFIKLRVYVPAQLSVLNISVVYNKHVLSRIQEIYTNPKLQVEYNKYGVITFKHTFNNETFNLNIMSEEMNINYYEYTIAMEHQYFRDHLLEVFEWGHGFYVSKDYPKMIHIDINFVSNPCNNLLKFHFIFVYINIINNFARYNIYYSSYENNLLVNICNANDFRIVNIEPSYTITTLRPPPKSAYLYIENNPFILIENFAFILNDYIDEIKLLQFDKFEIKEIESFDYNINSYMFECLIKKVLNPKTTRLKRPVFEIFMFIRDLLNNGFSLDNITN